VTTKTSHIYLRRNLSSRRQIPSNIFASQGRNVERTGFSLCASKLVGIRRLGSLEKSTTRFKRHGTKFTYN